MVQKCYSDLETHAKHSSDKEETMEPPSQSLPYQSPQLPMDKELDFFNNGCAPGEWFHMDMSFFQGTTYDIRDAYGHIITSLDGYNNYLLIINYATKHLWVSVTKSKVAQVKIIKNFEHSLSSNCHPKVHLHWFWRWTILMMYDFQQALDEAGYIPWGGGMAEPHPSWHDMMPAVWAVLVYYFMQHMIKNLLHYQIINLIIYKAFTGKWPHSGKAKGFGCLSCPDFLVDDQPN